MARRTLAKQRLGSLPRGRQSGKKKAPQTAARFFLMGCAVLVRGLRGRLCGEGSGLGGLHVAAGGVIETRFGDEETDMGVDALQARTGDGGLGVDEIDACGLAVSE